MLFRPRPNLLATMSKPNSPLDDDAHTGTDGSGPQKVPPTPPPIPVPPVEDNPLADIVFASVPDEADDEVLNYDQVAEDADVVESVASEQIDTDQIEAALVKSASDEVAGTKESVAKESSTKETTQETASGDKASTDTEAKQKKPSPPPPPPPPPPPKEIVLIGAGHAHLQVVKWWRRKPFSNCRLTLVSAFDCAAYSGMLPSTLASLYQPHEMLIDLPSLCEACGVKLIVDRANRLDPEARVVEFAHQPPLTFDIASINIGSVPAAEPLWQAHRVLISVKPLSSFLQRFATRFHELVEQWRAAPGEDMLQIVVVGAGASGVELAVCLEQHKHELELPADVRLVDGCSQVLPGFSPKTVKRVMKLINERGIDLSLGSPVVDCDDEGAPHLILENGQRVRADLVIWAAGASPPRALEGFHLPKSKRGFLATRSTLQTTADHPIFIAGDVADFETFRIPKAGVHAVREGRVLWKNLKAMLNGDPLREYRPQRSFLTILSCGDGTAILDYKGFSLSGSWPWSLKKWIDTRWVRQFQFKRSTASD